MRFAPWATLPLHRSTPGTADDDAPVPAVQPFPGLNRDMPVEVMKDFDTVLLFGRLAQVSPACLGIERMQDGPRFPTLAEGGIVLVRGYDEGLKPVILRAMVAGSSGSRCTVGHLELICHKTDRKLVRCPVCPPGPIRVSGGGPLERPQPCQLLNVSTGGACIVSDQRYRTGQSLRLRISPAETGAPYPCQVVRATPRSGGFFEYGLRFVHLSRAQRGYLAQEIQAIREELKKRLLKQTHAGWRGESSPE